MDTLLCFASFIFILLSCIDNAHSFNYDYSVVLVPRRQECFYQPIVKAGIEMEIEYQVYTREPIRFTITGPDGQRVAEDPANSQKVWKVIAQKIGVYMICLQNSQFSRNLDAYIGIYSDEVDYSWPFQALNKRQEKKEELEEFMDMKVLELHSHFENLTLQVEKMKFFQQSIRTSNFKDFLVQKSNHSRVGWFSGIQSFVMVATAVTQVVVIRRLFIQDNHKKMNMST